MAEEQPKQRRSGGDRNRRFGDKKNDSQRSWQGRGPRRTNSEGSSERAEGRDRWDRKPRQQRSERSDRDDRGAGRGEYGGAREGTRDGRGAKRGYRGKDQFGRNRQDQDARQRQRGDQRSANREDRGRSPDIDPDVTGKELNNVVLKQISGMDDRNRSWVSKHLVMAGRLLATDPQLAFEHALAASRRGGRHAVVREAVGLTAYAAGHYHDALREFRTYRRISGDQSHLPLMAASEAALGRPEKALELAASIEAEKLEIEQKVDMAIIISGVYADMNDYQKAKEVLELPQLDLGRAFSFSPRLFRAYGEALTDLGELDEAQRWFNQATVADAALGTGEFAPPEIIDLGEDEDDEEPRPRVKDVLEADVEGTETPAASDGSEGPAPSGVEQTEDGTERLAENSGSAPAETDKD